MRMPAFTLRAALVALFLLPLAPAEAGRPTFESAPYRDKEHKFSLKIFKGYQAVPPQPGETETVCRFWDPKGKGSARGTSDATIQVVRIVIEDGPDPVVTGDKADPTAPPDRQGPPTPRRSRDAWEATVGRLTRRMPPTMRKIFDRKKFKTIKSKDKPRVEGKLWNFALKQGRRGGLFITLAVYEKDRVQYGILMSCGMPLRKHFERAFKRVAESFKFHDKRAKEVERIDDLDGVNITPEKRREIETGMVKGWDVIVSPKKNYIVIYNTKRGTNHRLAKEIARRIEMIREQIYEVQFPPAQPIDAVSIVRVCENASEYFTYGGPRGSAGYWSPMTEELVFYDASPSKRPDDNTLSVLYHEAFHQYIHYSVGRVAPHSWFNEGHGDYYAGAKLRGRKFKIYPFKWRIGRIKNAIVQGLRPFTEVTDDDGNVRRKWEPRGYTPLEDLVRFSQREYYSYPGVCYAQGWSLVYFLREVVPKNKKYNAKWGHILDTYFDTLKAEVAKAKEPPPGVEGPEEPGTPKDPTEPDGEKPADPAKPKDPTEPDGEKPGDEAPAPPAAPEKPTDEPPAPERPKDAPPAPEKPEDAPPAPEEPKDEPPAPEQPKDAPPTPEQPTDEPPAPGEPKDEPPPPDQPKDAPAPPGEEPAKPEEPKDGPAKPGEEGEPTPEKPDGEKDGEGEDEDEGEPPPAESQEAPRTVFRGLGGAAALKKAVDVAFEGVDWEEFEAAWLKATKRVK
jgi:hypothetical protein